MLNLGRNVVHANGQPLRQWLRNIRSEERLLDLDLRLRTLAASAVFSSVTEVLVICMEATVSSKTRMASCKTLRHERA